MTIAETPSPATSPAQRFDQEPAPRRPFVERPMAQLVLARLKEFFREPEAVFWVYVFPVLLIVGLGIAFRNQPADHVTVDVESGPQAETIVKALSADSRFQVRTADPEECRLRLRTGKTQLVVSASGTPSTYEYQFDPSRPENVVARESVNNALQTAAGRVDPVKSVEQPFTEPGGRYVDFLVPGLLGMSLMGGGLWGVGFATVDMRIRKLLKRFLATPMRKGDFLAAIMLSRMICMIPEVLVLLLFARYAFKVYYYGSYVTLVFLIVLGATMFSGIGLLMASRAKTLEAVSGLMNAAMLPMWMLSGIFFTSDRFPAVAQPLIQVLPLTPLINALRSVMLEGSTLASQGGQIAIMAVWSVVSFAVALKVFRWQ
jgi:ABC-2 type transport system permease protein